MEKEYLKEFGLNTIKEIALQIRNISKNSQFR